MQQKLIQEIGVNLLSKEWGVADDESDSAAS